MPGTAKHRIAACLLLTVATLAAFWPVLSNEFVIYDTAKYVSNNPRVTGGITASNVTWSLTATYASNWHPLTWVSHMLDWELYGDKPRGHHLTNLLLHLASALLLFGVLDSMTGRTWRSAFVAALFAVHPLHAESVAWIAERKDVLSTLFWMLTLWTYVRYAKQPGIGRYLWVLVAFVLGLASKSMLVTLPFVLLALDYWPLSRWTGKDRVGRLLAEKAPLVVLAAASSWVTIVAQQSGGAMGTMERFPLGVRIANAIVSYAAYLRLAIWPQDLAVFYPHPRAVSIPAVAVSAALLAAVTIFALRAHRARPYLTVGWLWYLGTLVPVIGLVQVGEQSMADRYTYVPLIGIFIMAAWGMPDAVSSLSRPTNRKKHRRGKTPPGDLPWLVAVAAVVILALVPVTRAQVARWRDSETLFTHTLAVTEHNWVAHNNLGIAVRDSGRPLEAIAQYEAALRIRPDHERVHNNLGNALSDLDRLDEAIAHFLRAVELRPDYANAHYNLGIAFNRQGRTAEALRHYEQAVRHEPGNAQMHNNLGVTLGRQERFDEAIEYIRTAMELRPGYGRAHSNLAAVFANMGRYDEAWAEVRAARGLGFEPPAELIEFLSANAPQ